MSWSQEKYVDLSMMYVYCILVYACSPPSTKFLNVFKDGSGGLQQGSCILEDEKRGERKQSTFSVTDLVI